VFGGSNMQKSLLIIDDEKLICEKLKTILDWGKYGFEKILCTCDSLQAIDLIDSNSPDMIITDISMPEKNGLEIIEYVRSKEINSCIVLISAYDEFKYAQRAIELGVQAYLLKPVTPQLLMEKIGMFLNQPHLHIENLTTISDSGIDKNDQLKKSITEYIHNNIHEKISLTETAEMFFFSAPYFSQLFTKIFNTNFTDYVTELKIQQASRYLTNSQYKVSYISSMLGFNDYRYFCRIFKKYYGSTPLQYRKEQTL
jgi:two-component system response regulator YesN